MSTIGLKHYYSHCVVLCVHTSVWLFSQKVICNLVCSICAFRTESRSIVTWPERFHAIVVPAVGLAVNTCLTKRSQWTVQIVLGVTRRFCWLSDGFACKNRIKNSPFRGLSLTGKPFMCMGATYTYVYIWLGGYVSVESVQCKDICS